MKRARGRSLSLALVLCSGLLGGDAWAGQPAAAKDEAAPPSAPMDAALGVYLMHMRSKGMLDTREATLEEVEAKLSDAQNRYVTGDDLGSAILLFDLAQNPRYENFRELPIMSSVYYHLGVSLESHGADKTAVASYSQVLSRGTEDSYFTPSLRRHVDIALASKDYTRGLAELGRSVQTADGQPIELTGTDLDEREYLEARALQQQRNYDAALEAYAKIDSKSRFYTAGRYLQGVIYARKRSFRKAEGAFCDVIGGPYQSTAVYYVDQRYFPVRDLAHLGLGRVAHEELRHGHSFYHYFQVPQESDHLPEALFESAWTMAEEGEHAVARGLLTELRESYPEAPQATEARVLDAMLMLYDCDFREAEDEFTRFIDDMAPVADHIDEIRTDPAKVRALHEELSQVREGGTDLTGELPAHKLVLSMLDEDPAYARISHEATVLRREAQFAGALHDELGRVRDRLRGEDTAVARSEEGDALDAVADAHELEQAVAGFEKQLREAQAAGADPSALAAEREQAKEFRREVRKLKRSANKLYLDAPVLGSADTKDLTAMVEKDMRGVQSLRSRSLDLANDLDSQASSLASARLGLLKVRVEDMMGEARMGRIDAVLGAKKKLEIEVRNMAAGKFPPELFGKLQIEGMVGDDEEFWPYEGEYWADEYEGYR